MFSGIYQGLLVNVGKFWYVCFVFYVGCCVVLVVGGGLVGCVSVVSFVVCGWQVILFECYFGFVWEVLGNFQGVFYLKFLVYGMLLLCLVFSGFGYICWLFECLWCGYDWDVCGVL